ncbi:MAG: hypothetical protein H6727_21210 [Myxococcales bacterium]|nr:hypothetical protein [Myxococcales bacterium]
MRSLHTLLRLCAFCCVALLASRANAYDYLKNGTTPITWPKGKAIEWRLNPDAYTTVPQAQLAQIFQDAFAEWAKIKCASISFAYRGPTTALPVRGDNTVVVGFPGNFETVHGTGIVYVPTYLYNQKNEITEIDIAINPKMNWSPTPNSTNMDLLSIAAVSGGSLLGLYSSQVKDSTMEGTFYPGAIKKRTLHPDDIAGACFLYPSGQAQCAQDTDCPMGLGCQQGSCAIAAPAPLPNACKPCTTAQDCGAGMACDFVGSGNFCIQLCSADGLCPTGYSCNGSSFDAQCLPPGFVCKGSACTQDSDCPAKQKCVNGKCDIVPTCSQDGDCNLREFCDNGTCKLRPGTCNSDADCQQGEKCIGGACNTVAGCQQDSDCPQGKRCNSGICEDPPASCTQDSDCGQNQVCDNGTCKNKTPACTQDSDCPQGQKCENGACKAATAGCASDPDCPADHVCVNTQCVPKAACTPGSTQACTCSDGKMGSQTCIPSGAAFDACTCSGTQACTPGSTQACTCSDGKSGTQSCNTAGTGFDACACNGNPQGCVPGVSQGCVCTDGKNGSQTCNTDGKGFGACTCTGGPNPQTCQSAAQCGSGQDCVNGTCQNKPSSGCTTASDCASGQNCLNGVCVNGTGTGSGCNCSAAPLEKDGSSALWMLLLLGLFLRRRMRSAV